MFKGLTVFEKCLWFTSVSAIIISFFAFEDSDILTLTASLIGVTSLIFIAKGYVIGQILMVIFSIFYGIISFFFAYYGEMITYIGMTTPMAIITAISWIKHPHKGTKEVEVNKVSIKQIIQIFIMSIFVTVLFCFILSALNTSNLVFSTISVTTSFIAAYLTFLRSPFYALGYAANDIVLIVLWVKATLDNISYFPMIICFVLFLVNDIYGFYNWLKMEKRQKATIY